MMEICVKATVVTTIVEQKKDFYVQVELHLPPMNVMKNVEIGETLDIINVMMGILIHQMDVMEIAMQKLDGFVLEEIPEGLNQQLIFALKYAEMESIEVGILVMMEIFKMEMDVQQIVYKRVAFDALEETLKHLIFVQNFVVTAKTQDCQNAMMEIFKMKMDVMIHVQSNSDGLVQEDLQQGLTHVQKYVEMVMIQKSMDVMMEM